MNRNKIYAIVEGQGEANRPLNGGKSAISTLISKMLVDLNCWNLYPAIAYRMSSYGDFFKDDKLEGVIRYHKKFDDCTALLILLDMDDDCPKEKANELVCRVNAMEMLPFSVVVVCAKREYEAWFLASLETIHDGQVYTDDPENKRDAKGWLRRNFKYKQTVQQVKYTQKLDITRARERSRSFRRLYHAFEEVIAATQSGQTIITPLEQTGLC